MYFHPRDTVNIYRNRSVEPEHLYYQVHYFQQKDYRKSESKDRLEPLKEQIQLTGGHKELIDRATQLRLESLAVLSQYCHVNIWRGRLLDKLVHGMGAGHIRETSMTLHPVYGIPYIPGSSLKGLTRHWALHAFFQGDEGAYQAALTSSAEDGDAAKVIYDVFGDINSSGAVQFHDAFADSGFVLKPDVMTVHFSEYYKGTRPPEDNMSTQPINFYVVEAAHFDFVLSMFKGRTMLRSALQPEQIMQVAGSWLRSALTEFGIGSKTSSGYGRFRDFSDSTEQLAEAAENVRKRQEELRQQWESRKRLEQERKEQEEREQRLAQMSPTERLVYEIEQLNQSEADQERSKTVLYQMAVQAAENKEYTPAMALKRYWEQTRLWNVKKQQKKQFEKVQTLKKYLNEQ